MARNKQSGTDVVYGALGNMGMKTLKAFVDPPQVSSKTSAVDPKKSWASVAKTPKATGQASSSQRDSETDPNGFGTFKALKRRSATNPKGEPTLSYAGNREENATTADSVKLLATGAYTTMYKSYQTDFPADKENCEGMPASMAVVSSAGLRRVWFASSLLNGPRTIHVKLKALGPHRTNFACAEMQALNDILLEQKKGAGADFPIGMIVKTVGNPDGTPGERGPYAARKVMPPCSESKEGKGCMDVLAYLKETHGLQY